MQTPKTHDKTLLLLMGVGAGILLLAALGLFLVQSPDSPLPWEKPTATSTDTAVPPSATAIEIAIATSTGTRRPTHTPVIVSATPAPTNTDSPTPAPTTALPPPSQTPLPSGTATLTQAPAESSATPTDTPIPPTATDTLEPSATPPPTATLSPTALDEPLLVTGRVVNRDTPIANVTITLEGPSILTAVSDANGAYQFQVDWSGETYSVVFSLEANPQLNPASDYVAWAWVEGQLVDDIEVPDLEISAVPTGNLFTQTSPVDGSSFSAAQISSDNPLPFEWTSYPQAEQYWIDLGRQGEESTVWNSLLTIDTFANFDGTLDIGIDITEGTYWWAVGAVRLLPGFRLFAYSHNWTLVITP